MYKTAKLMWIYTEHPVHAGAGTGVGAIDLPIQREAVTNWPIIQASGLKGSLREHFEFCVKRAACEGKKVSNNQKNDIGKKIVEAFGPKDAEQAGALAFADAKILLFPVRSIRGTFAYVTCPLALQRLKRELEIIRQTGGPDLASRNAENDKNTSFFNVTGANVPNDCQIWVATGKNNVLDSELTIPVENSHQVGLEELSFNAEAKQEVNDLGSWLEKNAASLPWLKNQHLHGRLAIVSDNQFRDFVEMCTEVVTRNRIDDTTKTAAQGALWTEEHLPRETVLYAAVFAAEPCVPAAARQCSDAAAVMDFLTSDTYCKPNYLWIGGDVTVGRGLVHLGFA